MTGLFLLAKGICRAEGEEDGKDEGTEEEEGEEDVEERVFGEDDEAVEATDEDGKDREVKVEGRSVSVGEKRGNITSKSSTPDVGSCTSSRPFASPPSEAGSSSRCTFFKVSCVSRTWRCRYIFQAAVSRLSLCLCRGFITGLERRILNFEVWGWLGEARDAWGVWSTVPRAFLAVFGRAIPRSLLLSRPGAGTRFRSFGDALKTP